jgi:hypothetical protein
MGEVKGAFSTHLFGLLKCVTLPMLQFCDQEMWGVADNRCSAGQQTCWTRCLGRGSDTHYKVVLSFVGYMQTVAQRQHTASPLLHGYEVIINMKCDAVGWQ